MTEKKKEQQDKKTSKSRVIVEVLNRVLDWAMWIVILIAVYFWWKSGVWSDVDCSIQACNALYGNQYEVPAGAIIENIKT